jgi:hypothetical protein
MKWAHISTVGKANGKALYYEFTGLGADARMKGVNMSADGKIIAHKWPGFGCFEFRLPYP